MKFYMLLSIPNQVSLHLKFLLKKKIDIAFYFHLTFDWFFSNGQWPSILKKRKEKEENLTGEISYSKLKTK